MRGIANPAENVAAGNSRRRGHRAKAASISHPIPQGQRSSFLTIESSGPVMRVISSGSGGGSSAAPASASSPGAASAAASPGRVHMSLFASTDWTRHPAPSESPPTPTTNATSTLTNVHRSLSRAGNPAQLLHPVSGDHHNVGSVGAASSPVISRLTPPPLQPLAPTPTFITTAAAGNTGNPAPGSALSRFGSEHRAAGGNNSGGTAIATNSSSESVAQREREREQRIRVTSRDGIELAAGSSSSPSLSLGQASSSSGAQRRPVSHLSPLSLHPFGDDRKGLDSGEGVKGRIRGTSSQASAANLSLELSTPVAQFDVHPTFRFDATHRGTVLVKVQGVKFWVHEDILRFSSPFFEDLLEGGWKESRLSWRSSFFGSDEAALHAPEVALPLATSLPTHAVQPIPSNITPPQSDVRALPEPALPPAVVSSHEASDTSGRRATAEEMDAWLARSLRKGSVRASFVTAYTEFEESMQGAALPSSISEPHGSRPQLHDREPSDASSSSMVSANPMSADEKDLQRAATIKRLERGGGKASLQTSGNKHGQRRASEGSLPLAALLQPQPQAEAQAIEIPCTSTTRLVKDNPTPSSLPDEPQSQGGDQFIGGLGDGAMLSASQFKAPQRPRQIQGVKAYVELHEEDPSTFQDFLFYIYPHLDCAITWLSCGSLLSFSDKIGAPFLHKACLDFLRASLAGRPIEAMRLAEEHHLPDVYKEASRHVLDNWTAWQREELEALSSETLLKLERRRSWFLERVLKLGLANPLRDYECHSTCPDPAACAKGLHERWQSGYASSCRFAPPQPSGIWRYLRELDGASPLPLSACNNAAKAWRELLFDRMFNLPSVPHGGHKRQFLHIKLER